LFSPDEKRLIVGITLIILTTTLVIPPEVKSVSPQPLSASLWARTLGRTGIYYAVSADQTTDGGFVLAGYTIPLGGTELSVWVVKLNPAGQITWQKTYGEGFGSSVQQTSDGEYIVAAPERIMKLDSNGNVIWNRAYGGFGAISVEETMKGAYIAATGMCTFSSCTLRLLMLDTNGSLIWGRDYPVAGFWHAWSVRQTSDGGFILVGQTTGFGGGNIDAWVFKVDSAGNPVWQKTYGGGGNDLAFAVDETLDGDFIVAGQTNSFSGGFTDAWVLKLDGLGNIIWGKTYGGRTPGAFSVTLSVDHTTDGGSVVAGYTSGFGAGFNDAWVLKLDRLGNIVWQHTYGGSGYDLANSVEQTGDGGFIVAGYIQVEPVASQNTNALVLRLGPDGSIPHCHIEGSSEVTVNTTDATVTTFSQIASNTTASATTTTTTLTTTAVGSRIQCFQP